MKKFYINIVGMIPIDEDYEVEAEFESEAKLEAISYFRQDHKGVEEVSVDYIQEKM